MITASRTGKGRLYHDFADKRELVHAVVERQIAAVLEAQERVLEHGDLRAWAEALGGGDAGTALLAAYQGGLLLSQARGDLAPLRAALDHALTSPGA